MSRWLALALLVPAGCFTEPDSSGNTDGCTPGELLCECRPGDVCDEDLTCVPGGCIPTNCSPGMPTCECLQPGNVCAEGWMCMEGICHEEGSTSGMTSTPTSSASTTMTSTSDPSTTNDDTGPSETTTPPGSSSDSGSTTMVVSRCAMDMLCEACAACALVDPCVEEYTTCQDDESGACQMVLECLQMCLARPPAKMMTCIGMCQCATGGEPLDALIGCVATTCDDACINDLACTD